MTISSRTPEGIPHRCPICGQDFSVDPSYPAGDSCCPACGHLLWWFLDRMAPDDGRVHEIDASLWNIPVPDSLNVLELVMEMEEEFDLIVSDDDAAQIMTIADAIRFLRKQQGEGE